MATKRAGLLVLGPAAALTAIACGTAVGGSRRVSISLARPLPTLVRVGQVVTVGGEVHGAGPGIRVQLEAGRNDVWSVLAATRSIARNHFVLRWHVGRSGGAGPIRLRVTARRAGKLLAATAPAQTAIGPAAVYCKPPAPPAVNIPAGDGWIVGGLYIEGGPFPGIYECSSQAYTVLAKNSSGAAAAHENVPGGHSYTLVVPAGNYTLQSNFCRGSATVTAAKRTRANTYCYVP